MLPDGVSIRQLGPDDWTIFKTVRLSALQQDPHVFGSHYEKEAAFSDGEWQDLLRDTGRGVFCLFAGGRPVGMTGVRADPDDPATAVLWGSWIDREWRGKGLSRALYHVRLAWAGAQPDIRRIVVSHRADNMASMQANRKHGFVHTHAEDRLWQDGVTEAEVFYELVLGKESG